MTDQHSSHVSEHYHEQNLIWIDMEMTGLDPEECVVLEIATIVTDAQLNILAEGPVIAIYQPDDVLANMNEWCIETHGKTADWKPTGVTIRLPAKHSKKHWRFNLT